MGQFSPLLSVSGYPPTILFLPIRSPSFSSRAFDLLAHPSLSLALGPPMVYDFPVTPRLKPESSLHLNQLYAPFRLTGCGEE